MLTIHQLEVFVTVVDHGSIRRAAEHLVVSQPAVSASLAALERALGADLVRRNGRGIELTPTGVLIDGYARRILGLVREAVAAVRPPATETVVRVGATGTSADQVVMPLVARLRDRHPAARITVEVRNASHIWQLLADGSVDVAVTTRPPVTGRFVSLATRDNELVLVSSPGCVWPATIGEVTWLVREEGSSTRAAADEVIARLAIAPPTMVIGADRAIQQLAEAGLGVALLPVDAVAPALRDRTLVTIRTDATPLARPWHLVVRDDGPLPDPLRALVGDLVDLDGGFRWTPAGAAVVAAGPH